MKTAVIYARYSSDSQTEQSIDGQLRVCTEYAKNNDILILDTYIDRAMTGTNDNRPDFQRMIKDSSRKKWDYVLVYKLDRFSRNKYETVIHKKTLRDILMQYCIIPIVHYNIVYNLEQVQGIVVPPPRKAHRIAPQSQNRNNSQLWRQKGFPALFRLFARAASNEGTRPQFRAYTLPTPSWRSLLSRIVAFLYLYSFSI